MLIQIVHTDFEALIGEFTANDVNLFEINKGCAEMEVFGPSIPFSAL